MRLETLSCSLQIYRLVIGWGLWEPLIKEFLKIETNEFPSLLRLMEGVSLQQLMDKLTMLSEKPTAKTNTVVWSFLFGTIVVMIVSIIVEILIKLREM